jgi:hypothetical protein
LEYASSAVVDVEELSGLALGLLVQLKVQLEVWATD